MTSEYMILLVIYILGFFFTAGFVYRADRSYTSDGDMLGAILLGLIWPGIACGLILTATIYLLTWPGRALAEWLEGDK